MPICRYCEREQPEEAFEVCRIIGSKVYRRRKCRACKRLVINRRRDSLRLWLDEIKKTLTCARCGFSDFRALQFHHEGRDDKGYNIADMVRSGLSIAAIQREIELCIVLCANCHQIEHYEKRV